MYQKPKEIDQEIHIEDLCVYSLAFDAYLIRKTHEVIDLLGKPICFNKTNGLLSKTKKNHTNVKKTIDLLSKTNIFQYKPMVYLEKPKKT